MNRIAKHLPLLLSLCFFGAGSTSLAQTFPSRPITVLQPYGAGVSLDTLARLLTAKMTERLGWQFVLENRPGADGLIAMQALMKTPADGYTLIGAIASMTIIPTSKKGQLGYDAMKDLVPLTRTINLQTILAANPSVPANTLAELVAWSKANPGKLSYATSGHGTWQHLLGELMKRETGLDMTNIPYKPGPQMAVDVVNGSVQLVVVSAPTVLQEIRAGRLKGIVAVSGKRFSGLPDLPAIAETSPAFANLDVDPWGGFMVRAGTPREIVNRLHAEIVAVLRLPEIQKQIVNLGGAPIEDTPEGYLRKYQSDITRWERVVRETGLKFE